MKTLASLSEDLNQLSSKNINRLITAQRNTAEKICNDIKSLAPVTTGEYINSIQVGETTNDNGIIRTAVYTDLTSEMDPNIVIGRMIEQGTGIYALEEHIGHTKTFLESGYRYWYVPATSVKRAIGQKIIINGKEFYIARAQKARPHFMPALQSNKGYYKEEIRRAVMES